MNEAARPVARSFKPRRRGLSDVRALAYAAAFARFGLAAAGPTLSLPEAFGRSGPFVLDIGFGAGEGLLLMAAARPEECIVGVEVHTTGLAAVLERVVADGMNNVRAVDGDAIELLDRLAPASLDEVRIWFPDPWPKQRQRHRRLVRRDVVGELVRRLRVGGRLHLATDVVDYSLQMQQVCGDEPRLAGGPVERPVWRPTTRFEARGAAAGRHAIDLVYTRVA
ncbi:MAG: tRNA (guanosine(46)-N7)-methyltransferase TrmB [Ilumatobacteraceae bacterium]